MGHAVTGGQWRHGELRIAHRERAVVLHQPRQQVRLPLGPGFGQTGAHLGLRIGNIMILARVVGRLYSTIHHPSMGHKTILVLDRLKVNGDPSGASIIAVDSVGAGAGQTVLVLDEGNGARQILGEADAPIRSVVVGIVDEVAVAGSGIRAQR